MRELEHSHSTVTSATNGNSNYVLKTIFGNINFEIGTFVKINSVVWETTIFCLNKTYISFRMTIEP
jgi:hypothetical protein